VVTVEAAEALLDGEHRLTEMLARFEPVRERHPIDLGRSTTVI